MIWSLLCVCSNIINIHTHTERNEYIENVDDSKRNFVIKSTFLWQTAMWKKIFTQKFSHFHSFHYSTPKGIMIILRLCANHKRVSITINMRHLWNVDDHYNDGDEIYMWEIFNESFSINVFLRYPKCFRCRENFMTISKIKIFMIQFYISHVYMLRGNREMSIQIREFDKNLYDFI